MHSALADRQQAIRLWLAGESLDSIGHTRKRPKSWFHKWWQHYLTSGPEGLYDLTRANHRVVNRTPPHIERAVLSSRRRLAARATPETRYRLLGAATIQQELEGLGLSPVPTTRTLERLLERGGLSCPPLRLAPRVAPTDYPGPQAHATHQLHQVEVVGLRDLTGDKTRSYVVVCKDACDQAVYLEFLDSREMEGMSTFLVHAWQQLGRPEAVQFDHGKECCGWGRWPRSLSQVIRLCVHLRLAPVFIPAGKPQRHGSVAHCHGWCQPLLLRHRFHSPAEVRQELQQWRVTVNEHHVHPQLGSRTPAQYRRGQRLRQLPADFPGAPGRLPLAAGKVTFIRLVSAHGRISLLGESLPLGKRLKCQSVNATLSTKTQTVRVYHGNRLVKHLGYKIRRA
jgi:putative transposase